jgi:UDP-GlcNAc:undecaprenyl-phosphate GlcNAc-1-phosphate transferase
LAGATFAFLRYNTYPASIFLGDVGSQLLGFSSITLAIHLTQRSSFLSPVLPLIILGFPILDTLTVMMRRIARGRSPFVADKTHFHHVLLSLGLKQSESVMLIYLIQLLLVAVALYLRAFRDDLLFCLYMVFSVVVLLLFRKAGRERWQLSQIKPLVWIEACFERLRGSGVIAKLFVLLQGCTVLILLITAFLNEDLTPATSLVALALMALVLMVAWVRKALLGDCLMIVLYLLIPVILYGGMTHLHDKGSMISILGYRVLFVVVALLNIMVSRLTRRTHGFQSTPLDFLVLIIALVAPLIPEVHAPFYSLGLLSAKIIICYFSCEVIFAEMRRRLRRMTVATITLLAILALRGVI